MSVTKESISTVTIESMNEIATSMGTPLKSEIDSSTVLLESGLDSLGFAMLVASLEEKLGYDPFVISEAANYPSTLQQFVDFYVDNQPA